MDDDQGSVESFSEYLSRERRLRNIHLEEIAEKTRVSVKMLQALESDTYALLPPRVYVIGFLQAYARHVGLDENEVVLHGNICRKDDEEYSYAIQFNKLENTQKSALKEFINESIEHLKGST